MAYETQAAEAADSWWVINLSILFASLQLMTPLKSWNLKEEPNHFCTWNMNVDESIPRSGLLRSTYTTKVYAFTALMVQWLKNHKTFHLRLL